MDKLMSTLYGDADSRIGSGNSFVDRLSCRYTVFALSIFAVVVTAKQWLGEVPISCWCPAHFTDSHIDFVNRVCWTKNTYYLPMNQYYIPKTDHGKEYISYYQWVALVLMAQAIMFFLPKTLWSMLSNKSGISVIGITDAAVECQKTMDPDNREKIMAYMGKHLGNYLVEHARNGLLSGRVKSIWHSLYGSYLLIIYIIVKLIYLANVTLQLLLINKFLGTDNHMYGFRVLSGMLSGESWSTSDRFPRVTLCDISIRQLGNIHNYTLQCSLPMNLFNEKIYIFLWFWFVMVFFMTLGSLFHWLWAMVYMPGHIQQVRRKLIASTKIEEDNHDQRILVEQFVRIYLKRDGLFILKMIQKNTSDMMSSQLICELFDHFKDNAEVVEQLDCKKELKAKIKSELLKGLLGNAKPVANISVGIESE